MSNAEPGPNPNLQAFQDAAVQLLGAARLFLDAAEKVVTDPQAVQQMVGTVTGIAKSAVAMVKPLVTAAGAGSSSSARPASAPIEHIDLGGDDGSDIDVQDEDLDADF